jgi:hypothetical protein
MGNMMMMMIAAVVPETRSTKLYYNHLPHAINLHGECMGLLVLYASWMAAALLQSHQ